MSVASVSANPSGTSSSTGVEGANTHHHRNGIPAKIVSAVADKLGMSSQDLKSQLDAGKSLADVAKSKGLSRADLIATIKTALTAGHTAEGSQASATTSGGTSSTTGTSSRKGPSLDDIANKIADRVQKAHHRHQESQSASASASASSSTTGTNRTTEAMLLGLGGTVDTSA